MLFRVQVGTEVGRQAWEIGEEKGPGMLPRAETTWDGVADDAVCESTHRHKRTNAKLWMRPTNAASSA